SGPSEESTGKYYTINKIIPNLKRDIDFKIDEKLKSVILTEAGNEKVEKLLNVKNLYDPANVALIHHVIQALRAHYLFKKDVDYVVKDNEVVIVDEFTGRLMPGRRWSDGLHQAIEAKEGVRIESENQTLATITFQNYFRMYKKLAGMTGTADTEAAEFSQIYNLDVIVIPTNKPMIRNDFPDVIYKTERAKFDAVIKEIENCHKRGQPVLVGTISIEASEHLSKLLSKKGIKHSVLNAKYHEKEAEIIAQAGRLGAVTIATNMAGRGTDIIFGGKYEMLAKNLLKDRDNYSEAELKETLEKAKEICQREKEQVIALGGLHIIGTERHESRRIDNQLRGRAGRQGDPGSSRFYLSLEDNLLRIFGSDRINGLMNMLKIDEEMPIENKMVTKAIENAQKRVEAHNFDIRKHLLEYDDVMNKQRQEIYSFRKEAFISESLKDRILEFAETEIEELLSIYCPDNSDRSEWNLASLKDALYGLFGVKIDSDLAEYKNTDDIKEVIFSHIRGEYDRKEKEIGSENLRYIERIMFLQTIDNQWKDHLLSIDRLKEGIGLRGYAQKDPLIEYKKEAFELFSEMSQRIRAEIIQRLFKIQIKKEETDLKVKEEQKLIYNRRDGDDLREPVKKGKKPGRNEPCPCGSGRKYEKYCGAS
ncbi:MAG: preprotein translocase subunit SecA, partial [Thermodesulfovibrionales bacterium]|nr:preprotein translocase subunit SecA [Thermodesulfovibrionales bacterium]